jgi:hypothetical protein
MLNFGLACEGVTDQIVIENILCGYFVDEDDLDEQIKYLQPAFDETTSKQEGYGGWNGLLEYLGLKRFRDDVVNFKNVIVQVDTDVSNNLGFDVAAYDENNEELPVEVLIEKVVARLIDKIAEGQPEFYQKNQDKIIFCVAVHSIECWLLAHYNPNKHKIKSCEAELRRVIAQKYKSLTKFKTDYKFYDLLSSPLLKRKVLIKTAKVDTSLNVFINKLSPIHQK